MNIEPHSRMSKAAFWSWAEGVEERWMVTVQPSS